LPKHNLYNKIQYLCKHRFATERPARASQQAPPAICAGSEREPFAVGIPYSRTSTGRPADRQAAAPILARSDKAELLEIVKLLAPAGSLALVAGILAYRSPQLVKELFAGVGGLLVTIEKLKRDKATHKPSSVWIGEVRQLVLPIHTKKRPAVRHSGNDAALHVAFGEIATNGLSIRYAEAAPT
jgi:hypothetical protein